MADLKFYYHGLEAADIDSITSEATGYPKENLQDRNFNRIWKSSSAPTNQVIHIDLNEATLSKEYIILGGNNLYSITGAISVGHTDQSDYSSIVASVAYTAATASDEPTMLRNFLAASTDRYWEINLMSLDSDVEIGNIFIGTDLIHPVPNIWPFPYGDRFDGISLLTGSGGTRHSVKSYGERKVWNLDWEAIDETHKGYFDTWKAIVEGPHYPFYFSDKDGNLYFVRAVQSEILTVETAYQMYSVRLRLEEEL